MGFPVRSFQLSLDPRLRVYSLSPSTTQSPEHLTLSTGLDHESSQEDLSPLTIFAEKISNLTRKMAEAETGVEVLELRDQRKLLRAQRKEMAKTYDIDYDDEENGLDNVDEEDQGDEDEKEEEDTGAVSKKPTKRKREIHFLTNTRARNNRYGKIRTRIKKQLENLGILTECYGILYLRKYVLLLSI